MEKIIIFALLYKKKCISKKIFTTAFMLFLLQATPSAAPSAEKSLSLLDLLMKGGIIMIPILILSFLAVYIIIERYLYIKKNTQIDTDFVNKMSGYMLRGDLDGALLFCKNNNSTVSGKVLEKGLQRIGKPIRDIESTLEGASNLHIKALENNMSLLGIIAGVAPMLGFIGTILGIIRIFYNISLSDNISIGIIAGGLYEKMITSCAGLVVGVIAYAGYHGLNMLIDRFTLKLETQLFEFTDLLQRPTR